MAGNFRGRLISRILDFSGFAGKKIAQLVGINFADFGFFRFCGKKNRSTRGNNFSRISCTVFESNRNGSHMIVFVTLFATNLIEVQQCKKRE